MRAPRAKQPLQGAAYLSVLEEFYQGEILGEAMFDTMLRLVRLDSERYKIGLMLQLETETKARLRPVLAAEGLPLHEDPRMRPRGEQFARALADAVWEEKMRAVAQSIGKTWLPRYRRLTSILPAPLRAVGEGMIVHELALFEMAKREAEGEAARSAEGVLGLLAHPLPRPPP